MVKLYITYVLDAWSKDLSTDFTLGNCLFKAVKLTKNDDPDKHKHILVRNFHKQMEAWAKMLFFLELIIVLLCILMVEIKIF